MDHYSVFVHDCSRFVNFAEDTTNRTITFESLTLKPLYPVIHIPGAGLADIPGARMG